MVLVSIVCVLPLGLLRNVDSLSNVSAATVGFYFCLVMKVIAEAMWKIWSADKNINMDLWKPSGMLQCVPIFSMALFCQTQLFEIFESLPKLSLERMNVVTKNAINICTTVYLTLGLFGYIAFSSQEISGNILMSLSESWISDVIKLGFVMSVAFSFPLIIFPCRASLYSLIYRKLVIMIGLLILVLGTYANLQAAESKLDRYDEKYVTQERIDKIVQDFFDSKKLQKSEDTIVKPLPNINEKIDKKGKDIIVESEVQPPNPVPPESKENIEAKVPKPEQNVKLIESKPSLDQEQNLQKPKEIHKSEETIDKAVIDSHPRNLNLKTSNEEKQSNGIDTEEKAKEKIAAKLPVDQDNADILKQQQLIDTIKQHGKEQKELIKEQNEILQELAKTKQELQKSQKDKIDTDDAKKIAVESIQKIANIAIQSLGGITEKPNQIEKEKVQKIDAHVGNLVDNVEEVAKKAVEAIEAVKEDIINKEQLPQQNEAAPLLQNQHPNSDLGGLNNPMENKVALRDIIEKTQESNLNLEGQSNKNQEHTGDKLPKAQEIEVSQVNRAAAKEHSHSPDEPQSYIRGEDMQSQKINQPVPSNMVPNVPIPVAMNPNGGLNNYQHVDNSQVANENKILLQPAIANGQQQPQQLNKIPQQPQNVNNNEQQQPQQIINNHQQKINNNQQHQPEEVNNNQQQQAQKINDDQFNLGQIDQSNVMFNKDNLLQKNLGNNIQQTQLKDEHARQKREVIDCTEKMLKHEDKQICDTLIVDKQQEVLLPIPDLTVGLSKSLPLDSNVIYHIRSLKNVEVKEER
ncbi:Putative sodium-coupled neutral amino acid transporter 10 [Eumeta japonica]|uniref:Sodium-coupled neutral amino acid transporter 10 n=1 Tax=Eumeta variegata TaxID=151549 RepID=A0A4C1WSY9_EUMVA|nr:Putative sodium-coupled neutral amino acid transporter 10 [Eumeta japonica]